MQISTKMIKLTNKNCLIKNLKSFIPYNKPFFISKELRMSLERLPSIGQTVQQCARDLIENGNCKVVLEVDQATG